MTGFEELSGLGNAGSLAGLETIANYLGISVGTLLVIVLIGFAFKLLMYSIALYKTIERRQKIWFIVFFMGTFLLNDWGILAIIYLLVYRKLQRQSTGKKK